MGWVITGIVKTSQNCRWVTTLLADRLTDANHQEALKRKEMTIRYDGATPPLVLPPHILLPT